MAWFLAELARSDLQASLAFKGGTALKRCYFGDYRFSEDLDFTLLRPMPFEDILKNFEPVYTAVRDASAIEFAFDREDRHSHANSHTFYLRYVGPLPAGGSVKVDITIREHLEFPLEAPPVFRAYEEFSDLPGDRVIQAYSLAETATEKVLALADRLETNRATFTISGISSPANLSILRSSCPQLRRNSHFASRRPPESRRRYSKRNRG